MRAADWEPLYPWYTSKFCPILYSLVKNIAKSNLGSDLQSMIEVKGNHN
jgi:hypothetical protein